jgi:hypothetical protein
MYLFTRHARLSGAKIADAMAWATKLTEQVNRVTGLEVGLWSPTFSREVGTLVWATFVPDLATLEAAFAKLGADPAYNDLTAQGGEYAIPGTLDDRLGKVVHGEPDPNRRANYVGIVESTIVPGKLARGVAVGVEIAQAVEKATGLRSLFLTASTGNFGGVMWLTGYTDIAELERADKQLDEDQGFLELLDNKTSGVYTDHPGATTQVLFQHVA